MRETCGYCRRNDAETITAIGTRICLQCYQQFEMELKIRTCVGCGNTLRGSNNPCGDCYESMRIKEKNLRLGEMYGAQVPNVYIPDTQDKLRYDAAERKRLLKQKLDAVSMKQRMIQVDKGAEYTLLNNDEDENDTAWKAKAIQSIAETTPKKTRSISNRRIRLE